MSMRTLAMILWNEAEPGVEARDVAAIRAFAPELVYSTPTAHEHGAFHGAWEGRLPVWPFDRPEPAGLAASVPQGALVRLTYQAAYPMVPPRVFVDDPEPTIDQRGRHTWHVAPGGSLCLLQTENDWTPQTTPVDLLLKAAGWRIEFALMAAGAIDVMTTNGIVHDATYDALITETGRS